MLNPDPEENRGICRFSSSVVLVFVFALWPCILGSIDLWLGSGEVIPEVLLQALLFSWKEPNNLDMARVLTEFVPLSKLMAEQIGSLRNWSKGRARLATSLVSERGLRKLAM
jgi:hypothetical protein